MKPIGRILSAAGLSLAAVASTRPAAAQATGPDLTLAIRAASGASDSEPSVIERTRISGSRARMEIVMDPPDPAVAGTYMILNFADSTLTVVLPQQRTAQIAALTAQFAADLDLGTTTVANITTDSIEDLGPSEPLLGHEMHHYRVTRAAMLTTTIRGRSCLHKFDNVEEVWIAPDVVPTTQLRAAEQRMAGMFDLDKGATASWIDAFDAAAKKRPPRGLALRRVRMNVLAPSDTTSDTEASALEYAELSTAPIDPSAFGVPAGFQVQDLRGMTQPDLAGVMAGIADPAGSDSVSGC